MSVAGRILSESSFVRPECVRPTNGFTFAKLIEIKKKMDKLRPVDHFVEFYRRPRSKKKRIINKWARRLENWRIRLSLDGKTMIPVDEQSRYDESIRESLEQNMSRIWPKR